MTAYGPDQIGSMLAQEEMDAEDRYFAAIYRAINGQQIEIRDYESDYYVDVSVPDLGPPWTPLQIERVHEDGSRRTETYL